MKTILRVNGTETVVENATPTSAEFQAAVGKEIQDVFGKCEKIDVVPTPKLGQSPETFPADASAILWGRAPGILALTITVKTVEAANDIVIPAFIEFAI